MSKKISVLLVVLMSLSIGACSKSSEEIAVETRLGAFAVLDERKSTWEKIRPTFIETCNYEVAKGNIFGWGPEATACSEEIGEILSPLRLLEIELREFSDKEFSLLQETKVSLSKLKDLRYCDEWTADYCLLDGGAGDQAKELYNLGDLVDRWYKWKATVK